MNSVEVKTTTIAAADSGDPESANGAVFSLPIALAYSPVSGVLFVSENGTDRIRAMQPASVQ